MVGFAGLKLLIGAVGVIRVVVTISRPVDRLTGKLGVVTFGGKF